MKIEQLTKELVELIGKLDLEERVEYLNYVRSELHEVSPFKTEPTDFIRWGKKKNTVVRK